MVALLFIAWIKWFERRSLASAGLVRIPGGPGFYFRGFTLGLVMGAAVVTVVRLLDGYGVEAETGLAMADLMPNPDSPVWLTGRAEGPEGSMMTPVVLAVGCLALLLLPKPQRPEAN